MEQTLKTRLPRLLLTLALLAPPAPSRTPAQAPAKPKAAAGADTVVFAVSKTDAGVTMEPAVIFRRGTFVKPPVDVSEAAANAFVKEYFRAGRQYRLLSGGGEAGSVTVVKYAEQGCTGLNAEVTAQTSVRLGGHVQALAVSSAAVGRGPSSRRPPTDAERAPALDLARAAYTKNGVGAALVKNMEVINLTATDLDGDGNAELVGSFRVETKTGQNAGVTYTLFTIFEPAGGGFRPALTWFHRAASEEIEERDFVDQVDLDGDGVAEVIAEEYYPESNEYVVYKKRQGHWVVVYQGGGGGC